MKKTIALLASCLLLNSVFSQMAAFNQNASRSNHTRLLTDNWSFDVSSGASFGLSNSEKSLFRGNSMATKIAGRYQFGWIGLGMSGGLVPGTINQGAINSFLNERKIDPAQAQVSSGNPSNSYLLFGPSVRLGNRVQLLAELQGGMFVNNPGNVTINQSGVQRSVYRFQSGDKNLFPGMSGTIQIAYPIGESTRFFVNTDYFFSKSSVSIQDLQSGIDVPTIQNRNVQLFTAGVGITKTFGGRESQSGLSTGRRSRDTSSGLATGRRQHEPMSSREAGSGQATGRRILSASERGVNSPRDAASGLATGRRQYQPGQPVYGNITNREACGSLTQKITHPDGTVEENTFSCPDDAIDYAQKKTGILTGAGPRMSTNMSVGKQTQGSTFGEKVAGGLQSGANAISQGSSKTVISGKLNWESSNASFGIVTNKSQEENERLRNGVATGAGASAGAAIAGERDNGSNTKIYARDAASGRASGKRSREAGSGLATGRRQYQPMFIEGSGNVCNPCNATVVNNPLYEASGNSGHNPLHQSNNKESAGSNAVNGIEIFLLDAVTGATVAKTITQSTGDFWFANVPAGEYIVKVAGTISVKKKFEINVDKNSQDIAGETTSAPGTWSLTINSNNASTEDNNGGNFAKTALNKITLITSSHNGQGEFDAFTAIGTYDDGSTAPLATTKKGSVSIISKGSGAVSSSYARTAKQAANLVGINLADQLRVIATFSDGSSRDVSDYATITSHSAVTQIVVETADTDGDGNADMVMDQKIKTKSNIKNDRVMAGGKDDESNEANYVSNDQRIKTKSNIKNDRVTSPDNQSGSIVSKSLPVYLADADGDGRSEMIVGGMVPGGAILSRIVAGQPIGGIVVKGGKKLSADVQTTETNEYGEFEFTDLEPGTHIIETVQTIFIDDETFVVAGGESAQQRVQDHNSSRSNKSASLISNDNGNGNGNGQPTTRAQNNNTVRSNRGNYFTILVEADLDGDGEYETDISNTHSFSVTLDENAPQQKAGISTSRSNIRTKSSFQSLGNELFLTTGTAIINGKEVSIQSVLKTKHDTAKNAIGNIR